jgi:hypothetical protein
LAIPKPSTGISALSRAGVIGRGVESEERQSETEQPPPSQTEVRETSDRASSQEGFPEIVTPVVITLVDPLHVVTATGEAAVLSPGHYEIQPVLEVQIGLAREGQPTVLLHARRSAHSESLERSIAMAIPGEPDQVYLVLLTPDGRRFDAQGSRSGIMPRGTDLAITVPDKALQKAIHTVSTQPRDTLPACRPNPEDSGPRWLPIPCMVPKDHTP